MKTCFIILSLIAVSFPLVCCKSAELKLKSFDDADFEITQTFPPPDKPYEEKKSNSTKEDGSFLTVLKNLSDTVLEKVNGFVQGVKGIFGGGKKCPCEESGEKTDQKQSRSPRKKVEEESDWDEED